MTGIIRKSHTTRLMLILLFSPLYSLCQLNERLNADLKLQQDLIFGKTVTLEGEALFVDGYLLMKDIKDHPIFDRIALIHNDQNQLVEYRYFSSEKRKDFNGEHILSVIEKYYGPRGKPDTSGNRFIWHFRKDEDFVSFIVTTNSYELEVGTDSFIKAVEKFDTDLNANVIGVKGLVTNYYETSIVGKESTEYHVYFQGLKDKKTILMTFNLTAKDSKILNIQLDNDQVISFRPTKRSRVSYNQYTNLIELPKDVSDRIFKSSTIKILTTGEWKDEIEIFPRQLKKFRVIYDVMYN